MNTVHMMVGIQGAGKSTYAKILSKELNIPIISSDIVRNERPDIDSREIFPEVYRRCANNLQNKTDFIYDATNITKKVRARFRESLNSLGYKDFDIIVHYLKSDIELSTKRVEIRNLNPNERFLPLDVIKDYAKNLEEPDDSEGFKKIKMIRNFSID